MIGKTLIDRYEILSNVGVGGMAHVYMAEDKLLKRKVAIKILKNEFSDDEEFLRKFQMEAQLAASITHPHIVNVYDVGREEINGIMKNFIVMEYVDGSTLSEIIRKNAPLSEEKIVKYSLEIAQALRAAHDGGLIHRDIKPSNILITNQDEVKVTDFGIARLVTGATMTYTTSILGTVHYISPEQAKGQQVGAKSDLYSLGVVMYEMASGKPPFDADNSVGIALKHIQEEPENLRSINPNLSDGLYNIINKLLEKNPDDRFESANTLINALNNYRSYSVPYVENNIDDTVLIKPVGKDIERINKYVSKKEEEGDEDEKNGKKKWILVGIALVLLFTVGIYFGIQYYNQTQLQDSMTVVPILVNLSEEDATRNAEDAGLKVNIKDREYSEDIEAGFVIEQSIERGTKVEKGTIIDLTISLGNKVVKIPDLSGRTLDEARDLLESSNLAFNGTISETSDEVDKDRVIRTIPEIGSEVEIGTSVTVVISEGKVVNEVYVPDLENRTMDEAIRIIQEENLKFGNVDREYSDTILEGRVISQSPKSGNKVEEKTTIDLVISKGPEPVEPDPDDNTNTPDPDDSQSTSKKFTVVIPIADDLTGDTFNVKIYNLSNNGKLVFDKDYKTEQLAGGQIRIDVTTDSDASLDVYINDLPVEFSIE